jgi:hypothetical protein
MPGFADVTGWSSRDIQRLGHEDDNRLPIKVYGSKPKQSAFSYLADDVWAAACQAQRVNGSYVKLGVSSESDPSMNQKSNRQLVELLLADSTQITEEDREQGKKVRQYYQAYTFKILKGIKLGDFDNNAMLLSNRDVINSNYDMAVVVSLPASYERGVKRSDVDQRVKFATGGYIGKPTDKITVTIEVLKTVYSQKWNTNYFTGITTDDQVVFFAYNGNGKLDIGDTYTIQGTVKAHRDNSTQLNRVKFI